MALYAGILHAEPAFFHLSDPPSEHHLTLYGASMMGGSVGLPVATGDFDGDGFLDLVATPMRAAVTEAGPVRHDAGKAYVLFGDGNIAGFVNMATPQANTLLVLGARDGDHTGDEVWAGDVNGDAIDDLLLCAQDSDGPGGTRSRAGCLWLIQGGPQLRGTTLDLASPPSFVTRVDGAETGDRLGIWVRAGRLDEDGIDDIIVGADGADGPGNTRPNCGAAYILFGTSTWSQLIDLATPPSGSILIHGIDPDDRLGAAANTGDINGDGRLDVLVSAGFSRSGASLSGGPAGGGGDGPLENRPNAGETYVFFHPPGAWPETIDSASPPASVSMTVVYGNAPNDYCGEEVLGGDLNGDGVDEYIIGAFPSRSFAGTGYVIRGGKHLEGRSIDLHSPPGDIGLTSIFGARAVDIASDTMIAGDVDNDGYNDLLVGSPMYDFTGQTGNEGRIDILFGGPDPFPSVISLASPPPELRWTHLIGPEAGDILCYSMAIGDWDKDGFADPMPNGMNGDGFENDFPSTGDAYVVSGAALAALAPAFTPTLPATETPMATETPTVTATPTATEVPPAPTNTATPASADLDANGVVDAADLLLLLREMSQTAR
jgi:hypothetical protein